MMQEIIVSMGSFEIKGPGYILKSLGIGSCIVVVLEDKANSLYGMAHIMLGYHNKEFETRNPNRFADISIPKMLGRMIRVGAKKDHIKAKIAGGAHMFPTLENDVIAINQKNITAVKEILQENRIPIISEDVGGSVGRTIEYDTSNETFTVIVRSNRKQKMI